MEQRAKQKSRTVLLVVGIIVVAVSLFIIFAIMSQNKLPVLTVNDTSINVEIAKTSQERSKGLCCRDSLPEDQGMLFVFDTPGNYGFWMKDTRIPLDMYWINQEKKIVHIEHSASPDSYPKSFRSPEPAQYVLETNAGFAKKHAINIGDTVEFED